jgi:hypothetical protein
VNRIQRQEFMNHLVGDGALRDLLGIQVEAAPRHPGVSFPPTDLRRFRVQIIIDDRFQKAPLVQVPEHPAEPAPEESLAHFQAGTEIAPHGTSQPSRPVDILSRQRPPHETAAVALGATVEIECRDNPLQHLRVLMKIRPLFSVGMCEHLDESQSEHLGIGLTNVVTAPAFDLFLQYTMIFHVGATGLQ